MSKQLIIDEEFKNLIPPLAADEFAGLEKSILAEGVREAIITWNGVIVDGHNRYSICQKHGLDFQTLERQFANRDAAKIWIIENQFGRRNLSAYNRGLLALELEPLYAAEAKRRQATSTGGANPHLVQNSSQAVDTGKTREKVAKAAGVSHDTIRKIKAIEAEAAKGNPVAVNEREKLLSGENKSINRAYNMATGHEEKPRKCSICGKPIASGEHYQDKRNWCYECGLAHTTETQREYRDAEKSLRENKPVYNRASLIAELNGSAKMLEESWKQSLEINEGQGVKLTKAEKNGIYSAIDRLYTAIEKIKEEG